MRRLAALLLALSLATPVMAQGDPEKEMQDRADRAAREVKPVLYGAGGLLCVGLTALGVGLLFMVGPPFIAALRGHPDTLAIAAVSVLLSWTCLGWVVALVWALKSFPEAGPVVIVDGRRRRD